MRAVEVVGGSFTENMSPNNTHLLLPFTTGEEEGGQGGGLSVCGGGGWVGGGLGARWGDQR